MAEQLDGEIVNADSMQVYKGMDIGTAKPTINERERIPHHVIDIVYPNDAFDVLRFKDLADGAILKIWQAKKNVLVVGGTGLYIKILTQGIFSCPRGDNSIRQSLKDNLEAYGSKYLYHKLRKNDPTSAAKIHPHDVFRIIRALEVYELTSKPMSQHQKEHGFREHRYRILKIGLDLDRPMLYSQIDKRCHTMIESGFVEEVKGLLGQGYSENLGPMRALGYRHMVAYIKNIYSLDTAVDLFKRDTRHYAKRQLTWFRKDKEIFWFNPGQIRQIEQKAGEFLSG